MVNRLHLYSTFTDHQSPLHFSSHSLTDGSVSHTRQAPSSSSGAAWG